MNDGTNKENIKILLFINNYSMNCRNTSAFLYNIKNIKTKLNVLAVQSNLLNIQDITNNMIDNYIKYLISQRLELDINYYGYDKLVFNNTDFDITKIYVVGSLSQVKQNIIDGVNIGNHIHYSLDIGNKDEKLLRSHRIMQFDIN